MSAIGAGDRIGNYILQEVCGTGSFAQVWKARHHVLDEVVAVKIPTDPQYVRNLQREGVAIHGLRHPNIVRALDLDPYATPPYLIMEYVAGPTLRQLIDRHPQGLPLSTAVAVMYGVLEALQAAHASGVIHRDLKPANILLACGDSGVEQISAAAVKVADFGLGKVGMLTNASIMQSGSRPDTPPGMSGTIAYMAPEQRDGQEVDQRSDVYACGMLLFEMLTGRRPQGSDRPSDLRSDVPPELDTIFQRCHTRIERRYADAAGMLADLQQVSGAAVPPPAADHAPASTPTCPQCRGTVQPDDHFCIHCGGQLVAELRRCSQCHSVARRQDNYCIMCGTALQGDHSPRENISP